MTNSKKKQQKRRNEGATNSFKKWIKSFSKMKIQNTKPYQVVTIYKGSKNKQKTN